MANGSSLPVDLEVVTGRITRRAIERALAVSTAALGVLLVLSGEHLGPAFGAGLGIGNKAAGIGLFLFGLGLVRLVVLIINGWWPVSPYARLGLSIGTLVCLWIPVSLLAVWLAVNATGQGAGVVSPLAVMGPMVTWTEGMCMLQLRAWVEARREGGKGANGA